MSHPTVGLTRRVGADSNRVKARHLRKEKRTGSFGWCEKWFYVCNKRKVKFN